jgi:hypothetical protein
VANRRGRNVADILPPREQAAPAEAVAE